MRRNLLPAALSLLAILLATPAQAQTRCGEARPVKQVAERSTANIDTEKFLNHVRNEFAGEFKGYAVVFTGAAGERLGFRREGWAVDPCDGRGVRFDLNTESAIGSITKVATAVTVLKASDSSRLQRPLTHFLPNRWRDRTHPFYEGVTIEELLQHKGGFVKSGGGQHIADRLANGRERSATDYAERPRFYSNTSMGIFHFIFAKYGWLSTNFLKRSLTDVEVEHRNSSLSTYNREIQKVTSAAFNHGLYRQVLQPLEISATCDPRRQQFPPSSVIRIPPNAPIEYFPFFPVARSYSSPADSRGRLLASTMENCAAGGLYMSAKDLAKFTIALSDPDFLSEADRSLMMNAGPAADLYAFNAIQAEGGRAFWHNGRRSEAGHVSYALMIRFASGAHAVFVTNSNNDGVAVRNTLREAYRLARQ